MNQKQTNSWHSALCQSDTSLQSLKDLIYLHLQLGPYLWLLMQLSGCSIYLFSDRHEQGIHLGPGIKLEFEGHINSDLKGQTKHMGLNMKGVQDSSPAMLKCGLILSS